MLFEMNLAFCVFVVLTGSSQTRDQSSPLLDVLSLAASPDPTEDPGNAVSQQAQSEDETSTETITITKTKWIVQSETVTNAAYTVHSAVATSLNMSMPVVMTVSSSSAAADNLSSVPAAQSSSPPQHSSSTLTTDPFTTLLSQLAHTVQHTSYTFQPESESLAVATTEHPLTSAPDRGPAGPTHRKVPSELNVGDEDLNGPGYHPSSPLDPLLAGLLSVFIVSTAIVFVVLFLKFRQRTNHPEFHRLQDLPMDDLMEDTPLSRYTY